MDTDYIVGFASALCAMLVGFVLACSVGVASVPQARLAPSPALVAYGCPDSVGAIYAMSEDDFPLGCRSIERIR